MPTSRIETQHSVASGKWDFLSWMDCQSQKTPLEAHRTPGTEGKPLKKVNGRQTPAFHSPF